jgi:hypothetical protein
VTNTLIVSTEDQRFVVVEEANNTVSVSSPGPQGIPGFGVPPGGATGDLFVKTSPADYDIAWTDSITVDKLTFDITANESLDAEGQIAWNADEETIDVKLNGFTMHTGQHTVYHVKNKTGTQIAKGAAVMFAGTEGNSSKLLIQPWNGTGPSQYFMGITAEALPHEAEGFVIQFGKLRGIRTNGGNYGETWVNGDIIYAGSTAGTLTKVPPVAPSPKIIVCAVVSAHPSNGTLFIRPTFSDGIGELEGVSISSLSAAQILVANSAGTVFQNRSLSGDVTIDSTGKATVFQEKGPTFTYTGSLLTRIDYDSGNYKLLTYSGSTLTQTQYILPDKTITKVFNYNLDGSLASITETES